MSLLLESIMESSFNLIEKLQHTKDVHSKELLIVGYLENRSDQTFIEDFKAGLEWFNVSEPISITRNLKGKLVLLDFFTYCCINCLHVLPQLKKIEEAYSVEDGLVVVGVHSAKFDNEKDTDNIKAALQKYDITHPVVNDADGIMWGTLGIPCWPTMLLIGPDGDAIFMAVGETNVPELKAVIKSAFDFYKKKGELSCHSIPIAPASYLAPSGPLLFPGKVACYEDYFGLQERDILAIADTGNHRILVGWDSGEIKCVVGGPKPGFVDGKFAEARFNNPQGIVFYDCDTLYVADTDNNAIRMIRLRTREVTTIVGSPAQRNNAPTPKDIPSSPWDLSVLPNKSAIIVAAAGSHQLWALALGNCSFWRNISLKYGDCVPIAGTGREENRNNSYPHAAAFAQPSGICVAVEMAAAFIADSESSSIRRIDLSDGQVSAVVGGGRSPTDLFCFGDVDGRQWDVRLQHPLGVAWRSESQAVYVVDSYNHKVKVVSPTERTCRTLLGTGVAGDSVEKDKEQFSEPGGLCLSTRGCHLYIADTNNNCIKVVELETNTVQKVDVDLSRLGLFEERADHTVPVVISQNGGVVSWSLTLEAMEGLEFTAGAPQRWSIELPEGDGWVATPPRGEVPLNFETHCVTVNVPPQLESQGAVCMYTAVLYLCDNSTGSCMRRRLTVALRIEYTSCNMEKVVASFSTVISNYQINRETGPTEYRN